MTDESISSHVINQNDYVSPCFLFFLFFLLFLFWQGGNPGTRGDLGDWFLLYLAVVSQTFSAIVKVIIYVAREVLMGGKVR